MFALNPTNAESAATFLAKASAGPLPSKTSSISVMAKIAIAAGCIAAVGLLLLIIFFFLRKRKQASADTEKPQTNSDYYDSFQGHSPTTLGSESGRNHLSSIDTTSNPHQLFAIPSMSPPKTEELHGISSPSEMEAHNQEAVELQGSVGGLYPTPTRKSFDYRHAERVLDSNYHQDTIHEIISPQSASQQTDFAQGTWHERRSTGTYSSRTTESTEHSLERGVKDI